MVPHWRGGSTGTINNWLVVADVYPNAESSAEFYEIRAGERACFQATANFWVCLISLWPRLVEFIAN